MQSSYLSTLFLTVTLFFVSCEGEDPAPFLELFSIRLNGAEFQNGAEDVPTSSTLELVFSAGVDATRFESAFSVSPAPVSISFSYANQASSVKVEWVLDRQTTYQVAIGQEAIGKNGGVLDAPVSRSFTTAGSDIIYSQPPCASASNDCLQTVVFTGKGSFHFYSSFPIFEEQAEWQNLEAAIIVVHGANRNGNDYFNFMTGSLQSTNLEDKVVLIAPVFKNEQEATGNDLYWSNTGWRDGRNSLGPGMTSSFGIMDSLITRLTDGQHFPAMKKIIITGHSSGGLFAHLYAAANALEANFPGLTFDYIPANSQYYYYPDGRRIDENTNALYVPSGCTGYDIYPAGFNIVPPYVSGSSETVFNERFVSRSVTYLLGNGSGPDPALNTTDCYATLLGSTRFRRGENMFRYMELTFPGDHAHQKAIVQGVGHDAQLMYQSQEFQSLLQQLLN